MKTSTLRSYVSGIFKEFVAIRPAGTIVRLIDCASNSDTDRSAQGDAMRSRV